MSLRKVFGNLHIFLRGKNMKDASRKRDGRDEVIKEVQMSSRMSSILLLDKLSLSPCQFSTHYFLHLINICNSKMFLRFEPVIDLLSLIMVCSFQNLTLWSKFIFSESVKYIYQFKDCKQILCKFPTYLNFNFFNCLSLGIWLNLKLNLIQSEWCTNKRFATT